MPGALAAICDHCWNTEHETEKKPKSLGISLSHYTHWNGLLPHFMQSEINHLLRFSHWHSITFSHKHALSLNDSKIRIIYPVLILLICSPLLDCTQILSGYPTSLYIPCSQWKQILPLFIGVILGWLKSVNKFHSPGTEWRIPFKG